MLGILLAAIKNPMNRYDFFTVFQENLDGSLTPRMPITVNGVTFGQTISFRPGVSFGGVDFHRYRGQAILGEESNGVLIVRGFFNN